MVTFKGFIMLTRGSISLIAILLILAVGAGIFFAFRGMNNDALPAPNNNAGNDNGDNGGTAEEPDEPDIIETSLVRVTAPARNAMVRSPLAVTGEARGNWYFEASFPLRVIDANGRQLGVSYAQAEGEWMTTNFVPFRGAISFSNPSTATGFLVLEKDNPSGLPENAAEVRVPIRFAQTSAQTRVIKIYQYDEARDKDASGNILCSAKGLMGVDRTIPFTNTPIQDAVREWLKSEPSLAGITLTSASLSGGVLTLTFSDPQNKTSGGSCRVSILRAQVEATAKQFGGVTTVRLEPSSVFQP
jgi:hypothetical protein